MRLRTCITIACLTVLPFSVGCLAAGVVGGVVLSQELLDNNTRFIPGDGVSPIVAMLQKLAAKGYSGPLSVELFLPRFRDGNPYEIAREIRQKCETVMGRAGVL